MGYSCHDCAIAGMIHSNDYNFLPCFGMFWHCSCQLQVLWPFQSIS